MSMSYFGSLKIPDRRLFNTKFGGAYRIEPMTLPSMEAPSQLRQCPELLAIVTKTHPFLEASSFSAATRPPGPVLFQTVCFIPEAAPCVPA